MKRESFIAVGGALAVVALLAVVATGCQSESSSGSRAPETSAPSNRRRVEPSSTTTTTVAPASTDPSDAVGELRTKLQANGLCDALSTFVPLLPVTVTGLENCEDGYLLITLPSQTERDIVLLYITDYPCDAPNHIAVSDTWIVFPIPATATRAARVAEILGGDVREIACTRD